MDRAMKLSTLVALADRALTDRPPAVVKRICPNYYAPYYSLMYLLAKHIDSGLYVELGVEKGRGSGCLAAGGPNAHVIGLDHTRREELGPLLGEFSNFTFLERPSLPALETIDEPVNILHIDTEHSYAMAHEEFKAYQMYLAPGAVVLFDDLHAREDDVLKFFYSLPYPKFQDDRLHPSCGYGALVFESETS
jgi:hypothetical protein